MTKKKKIIISCIAVAIIIIGVITALILVNIKRYDNYTANRVKFNKHTVMTKTNHGSEYSYNYDATIYRNGARIVESSVGENTGKYGIYSYNTGNLIVDTVYDSITHTCDLPYATYFKLFDAKNSDNLNFVDQYGRSLGITTYDTEKKISHAQIMVKDVNISNTKGNIKTKVESKFKPETVEVSDIAYKSHLYMEGEYSYEIWDITTLSGVVYSNIYKIEDGSRTLVQTMGSTSGLSVEFGTPQIHVLTNGELRFTTATPLANNSNTPVEYSVYDVNYKLKGSSLLQSDFISKAETNGTTFRVGNVLIMQASIPATSEEYDYVKMTDTDPEYYTLKTIKLSLKTGKYSEIGFKYLITDTNNLNQETVIMSAKKIVDEQLEDTEYLLINERTQLKEVNYFVDTIVRLNEDRLIAYMKGNPDASPIVPDYNHVLLDNGFNMVCRLSNVDEYFSTENALIITKGTNSYVCNMDGIVVASYNANNIINLHHANYYMVIVDTTRDNVPYQEYYLENLGYRTKLIYHNPAVGGSNYEIDGVTYSKFDYYDEEALSVMIRIIENAANSYTYQICNYDGDVLLEKSNIASANMQIAIVGDMDSDSVIVTFDGEHYCLNR